MTEFNLELATALMNTEDQFPVDFDDAWGWLEYSTKGNAKRCLIENFKQGIDYLIYDKPTTTGIQAHPEQKILLTVECFKMWGMLCGTEKGKQVRLYFLECERQLKKQKALDKERMEDYCRELIQNVFAPEVESLRRLQESYSEHKGAGKVIRACVEEKQYSTEILTVNEYCLRKGLDRSLWNTFRKRYGQFVRVGKGLTPPTKKGRLAITGIFFEYADTVMQNVMDI